MRGRARANAKFVRGRIDRRVIKKCPKCTKEIPVACKTCPKCKNNVRAFKPKTEKEEEGESNLRRTERVRREQPKFFSSMEMDSRFKRGTKRKQSTSTSKDVKQSGSILKPDKTNLTPTSTSHLKPEELNQSDSHKPQILKPDSLDLDNPKKRRGRPKSVSTVDSDKDKTPEEDWYGHLPPAKIMQYKIILAEINRKISTQAFKPDG